MKRPDRRCCAKTNDKEPGEAHSVQGANQKKGRPDIATRNEMISKWLFVTFRTKFRLARRPGVTPMKKRLNIAAATPFEVSAAS